MATSFTITVADADAARVANTALKVNSYQPPRADPTYTGFPGFRPPGGANAAVIKAWVIQLMTAAIEAQEASSGAGGGVPPAFT
jgi:hypothetical protein